MTTSSAKGSILIAFVFVIVLTLTAASYLIMIGGRTTLTSEQLKRAQAINCAEAALYEAFNRFRYWVDTGIQIDGVDWDPTADISDATINIPTTVDPSVLVTIDYDAATGEISATVKCRDITI